MEEAIEEAEILRIGELASVIQDGDLFGDSEFAERFDGELSLVIMILIHGTSWN
jgi:hypothetical protein